MPHVIRVPELPESVTEAAVLEWRKQPGEPVRAGESLVDLETDKVVLEVPAPGDGVMGEIHQPVGAEVTAGQELGVIAEGAPTPTSSPTPSQAPAATTPPKVGPAARKVAHAHGVAADAVPHEGDRVTANDVLQHVQQSATAIPPDAVEDDEEDEDPYDCPPNRRIRRVSMSRLRARAAERLLSAQRDNAILTTFNEVNMHRVMETRREYREEFLGKYDIKLGLMSFFVKAVTGALDQFPVINASIKGDNIVYHDYCDIGIAVSAPRGLVVPVLRNAERMSFAQLEKNIVAFGLRARDNQLKLEELQGGTFTITNGGIFGSMLSTPIINPPQSAILGMHNIVERPVAENGQVVIRPVMYVALSYDHRLIDGREAVQFLCAVKQAVEDPARLLLGL